MIKMKLWVDDIRPAPNGYTWLRTVEDVINTIENNPMSEIEIISLDHDAGDYAVYGGDYIKILDWLEETKRNYPIHLHTMNPVGRINMRAIISKNNWKEIFKI